MITDYTSTSSITDEYGRATVTLNLPSEITGWVDVGLQENVSGEIRWVGFNIHGFAINLQRNWEKWAFAVGENYTAEVYVYDGNGLPVSNKSVHVEVYKEGEWDTPCYSADMPPTNSDGYSEIDFSLDNLGGTSQYELRVVVADGAAIERDWFKVENFCVEAWTQGSSSGMDELTPSENVRIMVKVTELVFEAPPEGEYEVWINVTHLTYGTNIGHAWFRVTSTLTTHRMICPIVDGNIVSCRDPHIKTAGGPVNIEVTGTGELKVILTAINDFWRNMKITYNITATGINRTHLVCL